MRSCCDPRAGSNLHRMRSLVTIALLALLCAVQAQVPSAPPALQFTRTVNVPLSKGQVGALVKAAWENSFALDPGARLEAPTADGRSFEGAARVPFRSSMLIGREQSAGNIRYRVTIVAENGSCQVRVTNINHTGSAAAKGGAISIGPLRETPPPDLRLPGLSRSNGTALFIEVRDAATARLKLLLDRFESTLRDRAQP